MLYNKYYVKCLTILCAHLSSDVQREYPYASTAFYASFVCFGTKSLLEFLLTLMQKPAQLFRVSINTFKTFIKWHALLNTS